MIWQMRRAIRRGGLVLHYQPKVDLLSGDAVAVEALVRWQHPSQGILPPARFVPALEDSRLVGAFNREVLRMAIRQARSWQLAERPLAVAVNLSPRALEDARLPDDIERLLSDWHLPARLLRLEITERSFSEVTDLAHSAMARFATMGISVALDDFGVGHSSMARLVQLPMDILKIDRVFVTPMATDDRSAVVVRAAIDIAHSLGLKAVAEGVETEDVWDYLRRLGCDLAQGFLISPPVPPDQLGDHVFDSSLPNPQRDMLRRQLRRAQSDRRAPNPENVAVRKMIDRLDWVAQTAGHRRPDELKNLAGSAAGGARVALRGRCPLD